MPRKKPIKRGKPDKKPSPREAAEQLLAAATPELRDELKVRQQARRAQLQLTGHRRREKELLAEVERFEGLLNIALDLRDRADRPPMKVARRELTSGRKEATALLLFSDIHPEEVVTPETVAGQNTFDLAESEARIGRLIDGTLWMLEAARSRGKATAGYEIRDFILGLLGDLISNTYHADLAESVSLLPADAVMHVFDLCCRVIDALLAHGRIESLQVPCCMGNHDRMTPRIRHQTKAGTSLATIVYQMLERRYRDDPRVTFDIARGNMIYTDVYDHHVRWTHGDDVKYYGGVGGVTIPLRKAIDAWNASVDAALTCLGHWHQVLHGPDFLLNGSVIGYTAYAQAIKARFEPAAQVFAILDPDRGKRMFSPIQLQDTGRWS